MTIAEYEVVEAKLSEFNRLAVPLEAILDCDCTVSEVRVGLLALAEELHERWVAEDSTLDGELACEADMDVCSLLVNDNLSVDAVHALALSARNSLLAAFQL